MKNKRQILENIFLMCCQEYNVDPKDVLSKLRLDALVAPRHLYCYLSSKFTDYTLNDIADFINRDHCTVVHGRKKISNEIKIYPALKEIVDRLSLRLKHLPVETSCTVNIEKSSPNFTI
jgi:chromosomal replication initiation ATPase DnaA